jgi:hypothetical protein
MSNSPASLATLRALRSALENAPDSQIVRIVNLVDALDDRHGAEEILAPIRARLRPLQLERPLRFSRLLATPLDPLLADAGRWRPFAASLPRSAICPLCDEVMAKAPDLAADIEAAIANVTTRDTARVRQAGARLWPGAAKILLNAQEPPASWKPAGLPEASFVPLAHGAGLCLENAVRLDILGDPTASLNQIDQGLSAMLRHAAKLGPTPWSMMLALMFCALPNAQAPRDAVLNQGAVLALRAAADAALQQVWNWIESAGVEAPRDLNAAASSLRQRATVLAALSAVKAQRARVAEMQTNLRTAYTHYIADAAQERLMAPLAALIAPPDDATMNVLEAEARGLRRLALDIRGLGGPPPADAALRQAARAASTCAVLTPIDRARLVELLEDPDTAAKLLTAL